MLNRLICTTLIALFLTASAFAAAPTTHPAPNRRILIADYSTKRIAILAPDGKIEWEYKVDGIHDLHALPNGHVLFQTSMTRLLEVDPSTNAVVWEYDATKTNREDGKRVEVHAFQRLSGGATMIAESGAARIIEVDPEGTIVRQIKLKVDHPSTHSDTRLVRKLDSGNYLVCHERDGVIREYDGDGQVVWEYPVPLFDRKPAGGHGPEAFGNQAFSALRLPNGNTLIGTGNGHSVLEVTPDKRIVWSLHQRDLPGITLAWVTTLQVLPSGNIVIGNCHAGPDNPQVIEVTRDKRVVWTFKEFTRFGNATSNSQVLDEPDTSIR